MWNVTGVALGADKVTVNLNGVVPPVLPSLCDESPIVRVGTPADAWSDTNARSVIKTAPLVFWSKTRFTDAMLWMSTPVKALSGTRTVFNTTLGTTPLVAPGG